MSLSPASQIMSGTGLRKTMKWLVSTEVLSGALCLLFCSALVTQTFIKNKVSHIITIAGGTKLLTAIFSCFMHCLVNMRKFMMDFIQMDFYTFEALLHDDHLTHVCMSVRRMTSITNIIYGEGEFSVLMPVH